MLTNKDELISKMREDAEFAIRNIEIGIYEFDIISSALQNKKARYKVAAILNSRDEELKMRFKQSDEYEALKQEIEKAKSENPAAFQLALEELTVEEQAGHSMGAK